MLSRSLRYLSLIIGVVLSTLIVGPSVNALNPSAIQPTAIQTRVASCQGLNFHPIDSDTKYSYEGPELYLDDSPSTGFFLCDPKLPDRAVVTRVQFTLRDENFVAQVRYCLLFRSGLTASTATTLQVMAQVQPTGIGAAPGIVRRSTSSIAHAVVNNAAWAYALQCQINITDVTGVKLVGIYGGSVTYQISSANG
jgi:hypothetical protein